MTPEGLVYCRGYSTFGGQVQRNQLVGQVFGRLTVIGSAGVNRKQNVRWECRCECGGTAIAMAYDLRAGKVKSCGCLVSEGTVTTHGLARSGKRRTRVYSVWASMKARCLNPNDPSFQHYGGRGIGVCEKWMSFLGFFADMGHPPPGMSLERIDNDKGYAPDNCVWAPISRQARNKRNNVYVQVDGETMVVADALIRVGKTRQGALYRMRKHNLTYQEVIDSWPLRKKVSSS